MSDSPGFLFITCQVGAEHTVKAELAALWPLWRFAYSRPGFLTFKLPPEQPLPDDFELKSVFARAYGFSIASVKGDDADALVRQTWEGAGARAYQQLHVWPRDAVSAGHRGYEPGPTPESKEAEQKLRQQA